MLFFNNHRYALMGRNNHNKLVMKNLAHTATLEMHGVGDSKLKLY